VDDDTRRRNRATIEAMSSEEMEETLGSLQSVLGPELFAKLKEKYATRSTGDASSGAGGSVVAVTPAGADEDHVEEVAAEPYDASDVYETRPASEVLSLCRSSVPGQRVAAIAQLERIMRSMHGGTHSGDDRIPRGLPLVLRCALDDGYVTVLPTVLRAITFFMVRRVGRVAPALIGAGSGLCACV
jgi:hypothetical protein